MTRDDARRKVAALRRVAEPDSGATPAERATAARFSEKLTREYRLADKAVSRMFPGVSVYLDDNGKVVGFAFA